MTAEKTQTFDDVRQDYSARVMGHLSDHEMFTEAQWLSIYWAMRRVADQMLDEDAALVEIVTGKDAA